MSAADTMAIYRGILAGEDFPPPGVPDTPENRQAYDEIIAEMESWPAGMLPAIPFDAGDEPDE